MVTEHLGPKGEEDVRNAERHPKNEVTGHNGHRQPD